MASDDIAIEFDDVLAGYGEFMILNNLSLKAKRGKITLLLGPNGAGKSTVLKTLFGLLKVRQGRVRLDGQDITGASPKALLTQHGVAFVPQGRNLFGQLTVFENLELGGITLGMKTTHERIPEVLELFPRVKERIGSAASSLSGGEQKQLEVGRALLLRPRVLLIDEPSIGLSPLVVQDVFRLLRQLADEQGVTILMVEQNVKSALKMADEAIALESGRLVLHKRADELLADPHIERLFLGGAHAPAPAATVYEAAMVVEGYSGATRVVFVVGDPIAQVQSPHGMTEALRARGADVIVVPAQVRPADIEAFFALAARMPNVDGIIVTVPHKFDAARLAHQATARARSIGAANMVRRDVDGRWQADMCDGEGYVAGLRRAGCEPRGRRALLVGAGGAGSAIAHALVDAGVAALALHDADPVRRDALMAKLRAYGALAPSVGSADPAGFDLVINATPMGMLPGDALPIDTTHLSPAAFVGDVVTVPAITPLIAAARALGCGTMTGTGMFEAVREQLLDFYLGQRRSDT
jgi:branched-chain amino acid transport system ATP-binding protein